MIEKISSCVEIFTLNERSDVMPAADAFINGKILLIKVGPVFSFIMNPYIEGLKEKFNYLKERNKWQLLSAVCTYEQAKRIVDVDRINEDFFRISAYVCGKVIVRIPVDATVPLPFPLNQTDGTTQFLDFTEAHPIRSAFTEELAARGCEYISITSGNISGAPTIDDLESAKQLAVLFNLKASFLGMDDAQTAIVDIPGDGGAHKGSYTILSFCNPEAVEVKRLTNMGDREFTDRYLKELLTDVRFKTPLVYAL